ncbi:hypothetical protein R5W23_005194 [Gemmata sp. JC673]|uniref:Uncharacterized protein n=1 Tax=Gemmata algarum TaxID=2975278 RepID=A0ABU5FA35_9BACT|nr:hypothetical protein [Gemmata algarum]MDY3563580.1 hypothetical protein [Gemmata algarum]
MSFSTDMAKLVADQLSRFVTLNRHQLAGQVANLDFWIGQVRHVLAGIDGYGARFVRMQAAQEHYVGHNGAITPGTEGYDPRTSPVAPRRVPDRELRQARRGVVDAARRLLERCREERLVAGEAVAALLAEFAE